MEITQDVTIYAMASLAETRDPETGGHIRRTQNYVRVLAEHIKDHPKFKDQLDERTIDLLYKSAPLHDVGKIGVPDSILLKPDRLSDDEFQEMKKHTQYGKDSLMTSEKMLGTNSFLRSAREIAFTHHEKWDGTGYPQGLKGDGIPLSGRLMALADVYDALISRRLYKKPFGHKTAVGIIKEGRGTHFDPELVEAFLEIEGKFFEIAMSYADSEEEKEVLRT